MRCRSSLSGRLDSLWFKMTPLAPEALTASGSTAPVVLFPSSASDGLAEHGNFDFHRDKSETIEARR